MKLDYIFGFAAIMAITLFVILDIEFQCLGMICADSFDQVPVQLLESMK